MQATTDAKNGGPFSNTKQEHKRSFKGKRKKVLKKNIYYWECGGE